MHVEGQGHNNVLVVGVDGQADGSVFQLIDLAGSQVVGHVNGAGFQSRSTGGHVSDEAVNDLLVVRHVVLIPVVFVALQGQVVAVDPLDQLVRTRTNGITDPLSQGIVSAHALVVSFPGRPVEDGVVVAAQDVQQVAVGAAQGQNNVGVVLNNEVVGIEHLGVGGVVLAGISQRLGNVLGHQGLAVGELHIVTQGEADVGVIDPLPLGSNAGLGFLGLVIPLDQVVEHRAVDAVVGLVLLVGSEQAVGLTVDGDAQDGVIGDALYGFLVEVDGLGGGCGAVRSGCSGAGAAGTAAGGKRQGHASCQNAGNCLFHLCFPPCVLHRFITAVY